MIFQMWNGAWNKSQFKVCQVAHASVAYLDKQSTLDPVMASVVSSIPTRHNFLHKFFEPLDVNSDLKCKCDLEKLESIAMIDTSWLKKWSHSRFECFFIYNLKCTVLIMGGSIVRQEILITSQQIQTGSEQMYARKAASLSVQMCRYFCTLC